MIEPPPLSFEAFMERALHDPERGYYARRIQGIGQRGDFTTAPVLSATLGKSIAAWAAAALRESGCRNLVEVGPGEGQLAATVLRGLPWWVRRRTRLHLVESSPPLREKQRERLGKRATWHASMVDAMAACQGHAVIFSNELVDAFSVRRFEQASLGWREIGVRRDPAGGLRECQLDTVDQPPSSIFREKHPLGQRVEVHDSYRRWLAEWMPRWRAGRMLTIDYGTTAERLYRRRPNGTLRAYLLQQRIEGPGIYENIGRQDLTADVNFTDLIEWSAPWTTGGRLLSFADFIRPFADPGNPTDAALLDAAGAGGAFHVLDQSAATQDGKAAAPSGNCGFAR